MGSLFGPKKYSNSAGDAPEPTKNYAANPTGELFGSKQYVGTEAVPSGSNVPGETYVLVEVDQRYYLRRTSDGELVGTGVPVGADEIVAETIDGVTVVALARDETVLSDALETKMVVEVESSAGEENLLLQWLAEGGRLILNHAALDTALAARVQTVNGTAPDAMGNVEVDTGDGNIGGILSISSTPDKVAEIGIYNTDEARLGQQFVISTVNTINDVQDITINSEPASGSSTEQLAQRIELTLNKSTVPTSNDLRPITSDAVNTAIQGFGPGEHVAVQDDGVQQVAVATTLNFTGDGVAVTGDGNTATINISGDDIPSGTQFPNALTGTPGDLFILTSAENQPADADLLYVGLYTLVRNADGVNPQQEWVHLTEYKTAQVALNYPSGSETVDLYGNKGVEDVAQDLIETAARIYNEMGTALALKSDTTTTVVDADILPAGSGDITGIRVGDTVRNIAGGTDITIASNGTDVNTEVSTVNFTGANISVTQDGTDTGQVNISITADQPQITDFTFTGNAADVSGGVEEQWSVDFTGSSDATATGSSSNEEFYVHLDGNSSTGTGTQTTFIVTFQSEIGLNNTAASIAGFVGFAKSSSSSSEHDLLLFSTGDSTDTLAEILAPGNRNIFDSTSTSGFSSDQFPADSYEIVSLTNTVNPDSTTFFNTVTFIKVDQSQDDLVVNRNIIFGTSSSANISGITHAGNTPISDGTVFQQVPGTFQPSDGLSRIMRMDFGTADTTFNWGGGFSFSIVSNTDSGYENIPFGFTVPAGSYTPSSFVQALEDGGISYPIVSAQSTVYEITTTNIIANGQYLYVLVTFGGTGESTVFQPGPFIYNSQVNHQFYNIPTEWGSSVSAGSSVQINIPTESISETLVLTSGLTGSTALRNDLLTLMQANTNLTDEFTITADTASGITGVTDGQPIVKLVANDTTDHTIAVTFNNGGGDLTGSAFGTLIEGGTTVTTLSTTVRITYPAGFSPSFQDVIFGAQANAAALAASFVSMTNGHGMINAAQGTGANTNRAILTVTSPGPHTEPTVTVTTAGTTSSPVTATVDTLREGEAPTGTLTAYAVTVNGLTLITGTFADNADGTAMAAALTTAINTTSTQTAVATTNTSRVTSVISEAQTTVVVIVPGLNSDGSTPTVAVNRTVIQTGGESGGGTGQTAAQVQAAITGRLNDGTGIATNSDEAYTTTQADLLINRKADTSSTVIDTDVGLNDDNEVVSIRVGSDVRTIAGGGDHLEIFSGSTQISDADTTGLSFTVGSGQASGLTVADTGANVNVRIGIPTAGTVPSSWDNISGATVTYQPNEATITINGNTVVPLNQAHDWPATADVPADFELNVRQHTLWTYNNRAWLYLFPGETIAAADLDDNAPSDTGVVWMNLDRSAVLDWPSSGVDSFLLPHGSLWAYKRKTWEYVSQDEITVSSSNYSSVTPDETDVEWKIQSHDIGSCNDILGSDGFYARYGITNQSVTENPNDRAEAIAAYEAMTSDELASGNFDDHDRIHDVGNNVSVIIHRTAGVWSAEIIPLRSEIVTLIDTAVAVETSARESADTTLQNNIDAEAATRAEDDAVEVIAREAGDDAEREYVDTTLHVNAADSQSYYQFSGEPAIFAEDPAVDYGITIAMPQTIEDTEELAQAENIGTTTKVFKLRLRFNDGANDTKEYVVTTGGYNFTISDERTSETFRLPTIEGTYVAGFSSSEWN